MDPILKAIASDENRNLELQDDQGPEAGEGGSEEGVRQISPARRVPAAPEIVVPELEELVAWDETVAADERTEAIMPEDEASLGEELVLEGADEADLDLRESTAEEEEAEDEDEEI